MYYKQSTGAILVRKSVDLPSWVEWVHHSRGSNCCQECLKLDHCWFLESKAPTWPHHPYCHCALEPIDYIKVLGDVTVDSSYSKYDPFLFNTNGKYTHGKERMFESWGYSVNDIPWLKAEIERQSLEKYLAGDYELDKLDHWGQRIDIQIEIPRKNGEGTVTFWSGWLVCPNGHLQLATPYGDD